MDEPSEVPVGTQMRLRKIDEQENDNLVYSVWAQDMDGKMYRTEDPEEDFRLVIITEAAYTDMVRRLREAGLNRK